MWRFTFINVSLSSKFFFNLIRLAIYMKLECIKDLQMSKNDPNIEMFDEMICGKRVDQICPGYVCKKKIVSKIKTFSSFPTIELFAFY